MRNCLYILFAFFLMHFSVLGGDIFYKNYTINDGLPDNCVRSIFKDSRGYIWIGTDNGVSRFDGHNFINYGPDNGLSGLQVWSIAEDWKGNMWFGTYDGGISVFDGQQFTVYNTQTLDIHCNNIRCIESFKDTSLVFIGTDKGAYTYNGKSFKRLNIPEDFTGMQRVMDFEWDNNNLLIAFYGNIDLPLIKYDLRSDEYKVMLDTSFIRQKISDSFLCISSFLKTKSRLIFALNRKGISEIKNDVLKEYVGIGQVFGLSEGIDDDIWIASWVDEQGMEGGGLYLLRKDSIINYSEKLGFQNDVGFCVFYDRKDQALWYGSTKHGLFYLPKVSFELKELEILGVSGQKINDVFFDSKNRIWIATPDTLYCRSPHKLNKWSLSDCKEILSKKNILEPFRKGPMEGFVSIQENDAGNNIIVSVNILGLFVINENLEIDYLNSMFGKIKLSSLGILVGASKLSYIMYSENIYSAPEKTSIVYGIKTPSNTTAIEETLNDFYIATDGQGLLKLSNNEIEKLNEQYPFLPYRISALCITKNGIIIIGSRDGKIYFVENATDELKLIQTIDNTTELVGTSINFITEGSNEDIWVGTEKGINQLIFNSTSSNKKPHISFYNASCWYTDYSGSCSSIDNDGNIWVGTVDHLMKIKDPENISKTTHYGMLKFDDIKLFNYRDNWDSLITKDPWSGMKASGIHLNYLQNYIGIDFSTINYFNPELDRFQYFLEGYDKNWSELSTNTSAVYSSLPAGEYRFKVRAINLSRQIHYNDQNFHFVIVPPFWLRWWFYLIISSTVLLAVYLFIYFRTKSIKKRERQKTEISEKIHSLEMKALKAQMNPHFIFNAITSIQNCILDNNVDSALKYLTEFSRIIRMTLDNVNREFISLRDEIEYINHYLSIEKLRFNNVFEVVINIDPLIDVNSILIPPLIIQPHIENAIHHGLLPLKKDGKLIIHLQIIDKIMRCIIEDNGIGRTASEKINSSRQAKKHISRGSKISKERIDLYNKTETVKGFNLQIIDLYNNDIPTGTKVILDLPFKFEY